MEIEEEVEVDIEPEESDEIKNDMEGDGVGVDSTNNSMAGSEDGKAGAAAKAEIAQLENGEVAEGEVNVEDAPPKPTKKMIKVKRTETVNRCVIHMGLNKMTVEMQERTTVFFLRNGDGNVPNISDSNDLAILNSYFEFNVISSDILNGIANLMHHVYLPVISKGKISPDDVPHEIPEADASENLRHELSTNIVKFEQQLRHVVVQSRGDTRLVIPNVTITNPAATLEDTYVVSLIENALESWTAVIANAIEVEHQKMTKTHRSPLGEIEFWRERNASLSALYDQISTPKVQLMIQVMKLLDNPQLVSFNFHFGELSKLYLEAKDNVKFLSTLERHFRHISEGSYLTILETMQSMVNGLRMVWVISRHYNTDERMAPLMETIAETLARRVREGIKLSEILAMEYKASKKLVQEARDVLVQWNENYFRMRKRIEDSGSDHRWEFDRKALFLKTDYMSEICANILEIIDALDHFRVFLGPELKAVTGDSAGIDEVIKRVDNLSVPLKVPFEEKIFDKSYEKPWDAIMKRFRTNVAEIEKMTELFIKESFRKLRSAEGAFELVKNFQKIGAGSQSGGTAPTSVPVAGSTIKQQISDRYKDILQQYMRELDSIKHLFVTFKDRPNLYKNYPPVAGAIAWARDLYQRAKRPILRFKKHGGLLEDEFGEKVRSAYLDFARSVDSYMADLFNDWDSGVSATVLEKLRMPVLCSIAAYTVPSKQQAKETAFVLPPPPYRVSFAHELKMIIKESRYLDKLGYKIPEVTIFILIEMKNIN